MRSYTPDLHRQVEARLWLERRLFTLALVRVNGCDENPLQIEMELGITWLTSRIRFLAARVSALNVFRYDIRLDRLIKQIDRAAISIQKPIIHKILRRSLKRFPDLSEILKGDVPGHGLRGWDDCKTCTGYEVDFDQI